MSGSCLSMALRRSSIRLLSLDGGRRVPMAMITPKDTSFAVVPSRRD